MPTTIFEFAGGLVGVADGPGGSTWVRERVTGIPWETLSPNCWWPASKLLVDRGILARRRRTCDVPSPRTMRGGRGRGLRACPGQQWRESSVVTAGLSLELRDSCGVSTTAAVRIPSFAGTMLSPVVRASCDERGWSRQEGFEAGSRCDGPGVEAVEACCTPEPLIVVVV